MKLLSISKLLLALLLASLTFGCGGGGGGGDGSSTGTSADPAPSTVNSLTSTQVYDILNNDFDRGYYPEEIVYRWETPIWVYTAGDPEFETAVQKFEALTGGLVTFQIVDTFEELQAHGYGIAASIGTAVDWDGSPHPGNVSYVPGSPNSLFGYLTTGELDGISYVNLGAEGVDDSTVGWFPSAVAEHELGHALLGGGSHIENFNGDEGISGELLALVDTYYSTPIGTPLSQIVPVLP